MLPRHPRKGSERNSGDTLVSDRTEIISDDDDIIGPFGLNLLSEPASPLVDFVFVHGLGGGSRKTWSKTPSDVHFWPKRWLPKDPDFANVRIWSFGYDSIYAKKKSDVLNIDDFGRALLGALSSSKDLRNVETPIVFIGHSMGGLVIKKTCILAREDASLAALGKRFHAICFLATPHRGSDWAQTLSSILQVAYRSRAYVGDLKRDSQAIRSINHSFGQYASEIDIKSFYETRKLSIGFLKRLIVEKDSATLDYEGEQKIPMYADHRSICKFDSTSDPNYKTLRDVLSHIVHNTIINRKRSQAKQTHDELNDLHRYLGIRGDWKEDLAAFEDQRLPGTCKWINHKPYYRSWIDFTVSNVPSVLWLKGKPASGKSVLAGYIIGELAKQKCDFSYFFFKHGDASASSLSTCLRSVALQMAKKNAQVRDMLLEIRNNDTRFELRDDRTIWRKLFLSGVFQAQFSQHYWVIDALDECADSPDRFSNMLVNIDPSLPLRILITSRESSDLEHIISVMGPKRCFSTIVAAADTLSDIRLLVEKRASSLIAEVAESRDALVRKIIEKSNGSFLWTALVLIELSHAHGTEEVRRILDDVPGEMKALYLRCLESMAQNSRAKTLIKAILVWATCSKRPLAVGELGEALKLDLGDSFPNLRESVSALCGQLLYVDRFEKVQVVHETAREFLLDPQLDSEFAVKKVDAHTRIAGSCLQYLSCDEMRPPRTRRGGSKGHTRGKRGKFALYASEAFSHHLARSDPSSRSVFQGLQNFLKLNILSWIEAVAETESLTALIHAAKHLARYSNHWASIHSPLGPEVQVLRYWSTDLVRIAVKFGDALVSSPSAIYWLIAPFCPVESAISQISISGSRLSVVGIANEEWDDRLACIEFHGDQVTTLSHGEEFLAVGLQSGAVALYYASSLQLYKQLDHGEPVMFMQFKPNADFLGTCGPKQIRLWNFREANVVHNFQAPRGPLGIAFDKDCLMAASTRNMIVSWSLQDGASRPDRPWYELHNNHQVTPTRPPCAFSISLEHQMMAVAYRGQPIILWDLREDDYYGICGKKLPSGAIGPYWVVDLVFNPNVAMELLAAAYQDGDLVLFDPFNNETLERFRADCHTLAASPNGYLLAAANGRGEMMIYEFETLKLLYCVKTTTCNIKQLTFSWDSLRFLDCRRSQCNVWEPVALLRNTINNDSSISTFSTAIVESSTAPREIARITAMTLSLDEEFAFCGRNDGQVALFDLQTGSQRNILYRHKARLLVHILVWWHEHSVLISVDNSNSTFAWRLKPSTAKGWIPDVELFHGRLDCGKSIVQLFVIQGSEKFILSTREADYVWNLSGKEEKSWPCSTRSGTRRWIQHPQSSSHIICVEGATARIFTASTWEEIFVVSTGIQMTGFELKRIFFCMNRGWMLIDLSEESGAPGAGGVHLLDASIFSLDNCDREVSRPIEVGAPEPAGQLEEVTIGAPLYSNLAKHISHIVGICNDSSLVFLDPHSWVCSVDLEDSRLGGSYLRHFFVPYDWFSGSKEVICSVTKEQNGQARDWKVLLARNDEVAIIRGGFEHFYSVFPGISACAIPSPDEKRATDM